MAQGKRILGRAGPNEETLLKNDCVRWRCGVWNTILQSPSVNKGAEIGRLGAGVSESEMKLTEG